MKAMAKPTHLRVLAMITALVLAATLLALAEDKPAEAAFRGENGEIAFQSDPDGPSGPLNEDIYVMSADGTGTPTQLTNDPNKDLHPAFSPNGKQLTFTSRRPNDLSDEIYVMNADGTKQTPLTGDKPRNFQSVFSPDGTKIAFVSFRDGSSSEIYVMNAAPESSSNQPVRLTTPPANETRPVFSPDGTKIAFTSQRDGNREIYVINADGTQETRLTANPAQDNNANFSPDGTKIAFNRGNDIYLMDSDGTNQTALTSTPSETEEFPAFSPDGEQLAFASNLDGNFEIYVMASSGTGTRTQLTETASPAINTKPDWGPAVIDTTPPTIDVPDDMTADATSPSGVAVTYMDTVTATDDVDPIPTVSCNPESGSTFPIGTTTVECTATDASGNSANASFNVIVKGATEQINDLKKYVASLNDLQAGLKQSLQAKLNDALNALDAGRDATSCKKLDEFLSEVRAQAGRQIPTAIAQEFTTDTDRIKAVLAC